MCNSVILIVSMALELFCCFVVLWQGDLSKMHEDTFKRTIKYLKRQFCTTTHLHEDRKSIPSCKFNPFCCYTFVGVVSWQKTHRSSNTLIYNCWLCAGKSLLDLTILRYIFAKLILVYVITFFNYYRSLNDFWTKSKLDKFLLLF